MFLESYWINDCIWSNRLDMNVFRSEKGGVLFIEPVFVSYLYYSKSSLHLILAQLMRAMWRRFVCVQSLWFYWIFYRLRLPLLLSWPVLALSVRLVPVAVVGQPAVLHLCHLPPPWNQIRLWSLIPLPPSHNTVTIAFCIFFCLLPIANCRQTQNNDLKYEQHTRDLFGST